MAADFHIMNLGCKVNRVESDTICAELLAAGGILTTYDKADVILINTCTVTGEADTKTRKLIRRSLNLAHKPWVIATGCAIAVDEDAYRGMGERLILEPSRSSAQQKAVKLLGLEAVDSPIDCVSFRCGENFRTRMAIKIQDGCDNSCAYCIVPAARGKALSVHPKDVLRQAEIADRHTIRELVLTGVNIGAYSHDDVDLVALLQLLLGSTSNLRIRLSSLEPQHLTDEVIDLIKNSESRICAHLHLPLQSGCDKTLIEMGRQYDSGYFEKRLIKARDIMPHIAITTDVIVGFPGENDLDFSDSLSFCESMRFSRMHVFRYSKRPGTPASTRLDQVTSELLQTRSAQMRDLSCLLEMKDIQSRIGTVESVLVESEGRGRSESYHQVLLPAHVEKGRLVKMRFTSHRDALLSGELLVN